MQPSALFRPLPLAAAVAFALLLGACSSDDDSSTETQALPVAPAGLGYEDSADAPSVTAYVDAGATNASTSCTATLDTNAGVRVLKGMLDIWTPYTQAVDVTALAASGSCAAVAASGWDGLTGTVKNQSVHDANIAYVANVTSSRTTAQALAAYMDDRRQKGFSVSDGMGPLTSIWRAGTQQTSSIAEVDPNSAVTKVDDSGNNLGSTSSDLGLAVAFIGSGNITDGSTTPAKYFYKYPRPWRWSSSVSVVPALESAKSSTPATDGGFNSGHTAEAWRDVLPMAYLFPQRYQELISRAMELGENRILAGMHSPLDVMGGRIQATAVVAYGLNKNTADYKAAAYNQVQNYLMAQTGASDFNALATIAHTAKTSDSSSVDYDRFADYASNKTTYRQRLTYGFSQINAAGQAPTVPKGAEVLLETRQPYLTAAQRRVVLKTTQIDSGYPLGNDEEGWGRLNLFAAADGYGAFNGDVTVAMDASLGGFNAKDSWKNDISGSGKLVKQGSGALTLSGTNSFSGGTEIQAGTVVGDSASAFGSGSVYNSAGTVVVGSSASLAIAGGYTQLGGATLQLNLDTSGRGRLSVGGKLYLQGGTLHITFPGSYQPAVGDTIQVISAGSVYGKFSTITVDGFTATAIYGSRSVSVRLDS